MTGSAADGINLVAVQVPATPVDPLAARVDAYVEKPGVIVMTDIENEPDD